MFEHLVFFNPEPRYLASWCTSLPIINDHLALTIIRNPIEHLSDGCPNIEIKGVFVVGRVRHVVSKITGGF